MILTGFLVPFSFSAQVTVALHKTSVSRMEQARMRGMLRVFNLLTGENTDVFYQLLICWLGIMTCTVQKPALCKGRWMAISPIL